MLGVPKRGWDRYKGLPWYLLVFMFVMDHIPVWHENPKTGKKSIKFSYTAMLQDSDAVLIL